MEEVKNINKNRKALIIGSAHGIGKALIKIIEQKNIYYSVLGIDIKNKVLKKNKNKLNNIQFINVDIKDETKFSEAILKFIKPEEEVDIFFSAGIHTTFSATQENFLDLTKNQMTINYLPHCNLINTIFKYKIKANIVVTCSLSSITGLPFQQAYSASKAATQYFYESISYELKEHFCRVFLVRLGSVDTGFNSGGNIQPKNDNKSIEQSYKNSIKKINSKRQMNPETVAEYFYKLARKNVNYGTYISDFGINSFLFSSIKRFFGARIAYKLSEKFLLY